MVPREMRDIGPYAPHGVTLYRLELDDVVVDIQPNDVLSIPYIFTPTRQFLQRACGPADLLHILASLGTLRGSIIVLPGWYGTTVPSLHHFSGLQGQPCIQGSLNLGDNNGPFVEACYDLSWACHTGNVFSQSGTAARRVQLLDRGNGVIGIECVVAITADRPGQMMYLEHPNFIIKPGDRYCYNPSLLSVVGQGVQATHCLFDRDGQTPPSHNPFQGFDPAILEEMSPERCFFSHFRALNGRIPLLLLGEGAEEGVGFIHTPPAGGPNCVTFWFSPTLRGRGKGVGSFEFGTPPLGPEQSKKLGFYYNLSAGGLLSYAVEMQILHSAEAVNHFAECWGIVTNPAAYPAMIYPDTAGTKGAYNSETAPLNTLRRAAGIPM